MEKGHWEYTGISWDFGPEVSQLKAQLEKPQEGGVGREFRGCPGAGGAGLSRGAVGMAVTLRLESVSLLVAVQLVQ